MTHRLIGRERELAELEAELAAHRFVTVVGPPGVGKSRLAEVVAGAKADVLLADGADLLDERVVAALAKRLDEEPALRVLATARRPLRAPGEVLFELSPLDPPAAAALLVERARAEMRTFELPLQADVLLERLGGLPLAIELAASRLRALGVAELAAELDRGLAVLKPRPGSGRRSLEEAFAASWDVLGADERVALARASIFASAFSLDDAVAVLALGAPDAEGRLAVVDALEGLVDQNLVATLDSPGWGRRFSLLWPLRRFAASRLHPTDGVEVTRRHAERFARRDARESPPAELEAIVACAERDVTEGAPGDARAAAERAVGAALALDRVLAPDARFSLATRVVTLAERGGLGGAALGELLATRALAALDVGRAVDAASDIRRAGDISGAGEARLDGVMAFALGRLAWREGRVAEARDAFDVAVARFAAVGDVGRESLARSRLASAWARIGDHDRARNLFATALARLDDQDPQRELVGVALAVCEADAGDVTAAAALLGPVRGEAGRAAAESCRAFIAVESGRVEAARPHLEAALVHRQRVADGRGVAVANYELTLLDEILGVDVPEARHREALERIRAAGDPLREGLVGCSIARLRARGGDLAGAYAALATAEVHLATAGPTAWAGVAEIARAEIALAGEDRETAERILAESESAETSTEVRVARYLLRARLGRRGPAEIPRLDEARAPRITPLPGTAAVAEAAADDEGAFVVARSGRWYRAPGGEPVSLSTKRALRLLMKRLADLREASPGQAAPLAELLEAAWPGERVHPEAGASRVYAAVATLRKQGLRDLLVRRDDGYLLDPTIPVVRAGDDERTAVRKKL